jgi:homoserine dehydrogenase
VPHLAFKPDSLDNTPIMPMSQVVTSYYLRIATEDKLGVLADITRILSVNGVSIEAIVQKEPEQQGGLVPLIMLTHEVLEKNMDAAITQIEALSTVKESVMRIRMESLG